MKKLLALLLAALMLCGCLSALAEAPDMEHSYCNPLNLEFVDVRPGGGQTFSAEAPVLDMGGSNSPLTMLEKETWTEADGRSMVRMGGGQKIQENAFRTTADIFVYQISDGTLVMHASGSMSYNDEYGACWTSTDYINWEYHEMNRCVTAPTFVELNGK